MLVTPPKAPAPTPALVPDLRPSSLPVFFDPSGRRWHRILLMTVLMVMALTLTSAWVSPRVFAPAGAPPQNQDIDYPAELLASGDITEIPLLGEDRASVFDRIALVERTDRGVFLKDPFSDDIFRRATPQEAREIGDHPYVMEAFGHVPDRTLFLTFDDGPDPENTLELLDLLSREKVPATFFVVGENVVKHPDLFRRVVREGHMAANHTFTHADFDANPVIRNREELIATDRAMRASAGYASPLFRIPEGDPHNNPLELVQAQQLGYLHINMDIDTLDWSFAPGEPIPVPELDGKGHVVLMHDGGGDRSATIAMVEDLIHRAKAQGYTFATVAPMLPPEYLPAQDVAPKLADDLTFAALTTLLVVPVHLITWLFWFGLGSLTIMSLCYVVLALIERRRELRKRWGEIPDDRLPFVSVILPVYNEEPVVARTLAALQASDYPAFEVVAINDGSTDGTLAVLREYASRWPQLRVVDQVNGGKSAASNHGIAVAHGDVLVTLDGDTLFEPHTIRMLARHFVDDDGDGDRPIGAVAGHVKVGNRRNVLTAWQSLEYISGICVTRMAEALVGAISIVPGACAAWRRDAVVTAGGYSTDTLAEDADLTLAIQRLRYRLVQENAAVAWTEAPNTVRGLANQRLRWTYGNMQALRKHSSMLLRPRYGVLGMVTLPYTLLSIVIPLLFLPLTVVVAALSVAAGEWQAIALFGAFVAGTHLVISVVAVAMVREAPWHLLVVPIYRLIYEPLRAYLLYASVVRAMKGRIVGWYKPERMNSVVMPAGVPGPATIT